jgi:hypothetical protein
MEKPEKRSRYTVEHCIVESKVCELRGAHKLAKAYKRLAKKIASKRSTNHG